VGAHVRPADGKRREPGGRLTNGRQNHPGSVRPWPPTPDGTPPSDRRTAAGGRAGSITTTAANCRPRSSSRMGDAREAGAASTGRHRGRWCTARGRWVRHLPLQVGELSAIAAPLGWGEGRALPPQAEEELRFRMVGGPGELRAREGRRQSQERRRQPFTLGDGARGEREGGDVFRGRSHAEPGCDSWLSVGRCSTQIAYRAAEGAIPSAIPPLVGGATRN
jgi:hypothetical protein